ncbi:hypothetical protein [Dactylosporangium roseum]|uniref:hypothetical protein n=1 Tax=Dactylosporangium roseum TaxID=47989 RepID=UPI0021B1DE5C|nr:hypothetical protein [Dactylosporangium roseum]
MTTMYAGGELVAHAQAMLDVHVVAVATGLCIGCGAPGPCAERERAATVFKKSLRLPHRTPGATRPEPLGAQRGGGRGWLTATTIRELPTDQRGSVPCARERGHRIPRPSRGKER